MRLLFSRSALVVLLAVSVSACGKEGRSPPQPPRPSVARLVVFVDEPRLEATPGLAKGADEASKSFLTELPAQLGRAGFRVAASKSEPHDVEIVLRARCSGGAGDDCKGQGAVIADGREIDRYPMSYDTDEVAEASSRLVAAMSGSTALERFAESRSGRQREAPIALAPVAPAAPPAPSSVAAPVSGSGHFVELKDGRRVSGVLLAQQPGSFVVIRSSTGVVHTFPWDRVAQVSGEIAAQPDQTAAGEGGEAQPSDGTASAAAATLDLPSRSASASFVDDCSADPDMTRCMEQGRLDVGAKGISASYSRETLQRVKEPPSASIDFGMGLGGGGLTGGSSGASAAYGFLDFRFKILAGGQFPGVDGGTWFGFALEPSFSLMELFISEPAVGYRSSTTSTAVAYQVGGTTGFQILSFGSMDAQSLKQSGFGLLAGVFVGTTGITPPGDNQSTVWNTSYGPVLQLLFPTYNAGTADYSALSINAMILPTGDSTLISGTLGVVF